VPLELPCKRQRPQTSQDRPEWSLICAAVVAALLFLFASGVAALGGRPIDFYIGGYEPKRLATVTDHLSQLRYIAADIQCELMRIESR
jgi:hypothetical protein